MRGERQVRHADRAVRAALDADEALAVGLQIRRRRLELVGGDGQHRLAGLGGGGDHRIAHPVGRPAGERAHVVGPGVGVRGVDDDRLHGHAEGLGRNLTDDGLEPLPEIDRRQGHNERAHGRRVDQRLRRITPEVHAGRVVHRGDAAASKLRHRQSPPSVRGAEVIAASSSGSSWPTSLAAACIVSIKRRVLGMLAVRPQVAVAVSVEEPDRPRVEAGRLGDPVHLHLHRIRAHRHAEAAHGARRLVVGEHAVDVDRHVRDQVRAGDVGGVLGHRVRRLPGIGARVGVAGDLAGDDAPVASSPRP